MATACKYCSTAYDDAVFYCSSCLQCAMCGKVMPSDNMHSHCADAHMTRDKKDTVDNSIMLFAKCPVCPGAGNYDHLIGHVVSRHASCRVRL